MKTLMRSQKSNFALVLVSVLAAVLAAGFIFVTLQVAAGRTQQLDERVIIALRSPGHLEDPLGARWLEHLARDFTSLGSTQVVTVLTIAAAGFLLLARRRKEALRLLATIFSGMGVYYVLKHALNRPRPELVSHLVYSETPSFPSGHAMLASSLLLTLALIAVAHLPSPRLRIYVVLIAILGALGVGISRTYLGVHWPTDVLAGWLTGFTWALLWWLIGRFRTQDIAVHSNP